MSYQSVPQTEEQLTSPLPTYDMSQLPKSRFTQTTDVKLTMPNGQGQPQIVVLREETVPVGMVLFFSGFVFTPTWFIGSFANAVTPKEEAWRRVNRGMSLVAVMISAMFVLLMVAAASEGFDNASMMWNEDQGSLQGGQDDDEEKSPRPCHKNRRHHGCRRPEIEMPQAPNADLAVVQMTPIRE